MFIGMSLVGKPTKVVPVAISNRHGLDANMMCLPYDQEQESKNHLFISC